MGIGLCCSQLLLLTCHSTTVLSVLGVWHGSSHEYQSLIHSAAGSELPTAHSRCAQEDPKCPMQVRGRLWSFFHSARAHQLEASMLLGIAGKALGGPGAAGCGREGVGWNGWDILGRDTARLEQRRCRVHVLQGEAEEGEGGGEGEMLPSLHHMQRLGKHLAKGFPPSCPFAEPQLQVLSHLRPRTPMAAKGWRQAPSSTGR